MIYLWLQRFSTAFCSFIIFVFFNCVVFVSQDVTDSATPVEKRWLDEGTPFIETRRTPDLENMDMEQYQQSLAQ